MHIVSAYVVTVAFSEGHAEAIGIGVRNHKDRAWDLKTEINGTFKVRSLFDDSLETTKKTKASRAPRRTGAELGGVRPNLAGPLPFTRHSIKMKPI